MNPLKSIARKILPGSVRDAIRYVTSADYRDRLAWEKDREVGWRVFNLTGGRVIAGPFAGLMYVDSARGSSIGPKLLGTYELELRQIVEEIIGCGYALVI